jgi:hypothetical protein
MSGFQIGQLFHQPIEFPIRNSRPGFDVIEVVMMLKLAAELFDARFGGCSHQGILNNPQDEGERDSATARRTTRRKPLKFKSEILRAVAPSRSLYFRPAKTKGAAGLSERYGTQGRRIACDNAGKHCYRHRIE